MREHFKDPCAIKKQEPKNHPQDGKKSPWDFTCPEYDQRSSCFVSAGTDYGLGHSQPVGTENHTSHDAIPQRNKVVNLESKS